MGQKVISDNGEGELVENIEFDRREIIQEVAEWMRKDEKKPHEFTTRDIADETGILIDSVRDRLALLMRNKTVVTIRGVKGLVRKRKATKVYFYWIEPVESAIDK